MQHAGMVAAVCCLLRNLVDRASRSSDQLARVHGIQMFRLVADRNMGNSVGRQIQSEKDAVMKAKATLSPFLITLLIL
jgi:hypothetical protein